MASGRVLCWTQHLWQLSAPLTSPPSPLSVSFSSVFTYFSSSVLHLSLPSRIAQFGGLRPTQKKREKLEPLMPLDQFPLPVPISITAISAGPKVVRSSEHLAPPPCFLRSVGSICLWTPPPSVPLTTRITLRKPDKMLWSVISVDKL